MTASNALPEVLLDAARALGLLSANDDVDADWFADPLAHVHSLLGDADQRQALFRLTKAMALESRTEDGVTWYRVGGPLWLTLAERAGVANLGFGVRLGEENQLRVHVELARVVDDVVELPLGPLSAELVVPLEWRRPLRRVDLRAVRIKADVESSGVNARIVLEGLDSDGSGERDRVLDSRSPTGDEAHLLLSLLAEELDATGGPAEHLIALLGMGDGIPALPLSSPSLLGAWREWFAELVDGPSPAAPRWLGHLAALLGGDITTNGSGTALDPWRARAVALGPTAFFDLTLARDDGATGERRALLGLDVQLTGASAPATVQASAYALAVPLAGTAPAQAIPSIRLALTKSFAADLPAKAISAGVEWSRARGRLEPVVELRDVELLGAHYDRLDLSDASTMTATAATAVASALAELLGPRVGALAGLTSPQSDPQWPHLVDPVALASRPLEAIAAVHRAALADPVHDWSHLFGELAGLLAPETVPTGTGAPTDPWRAQLGEVGLLALELAAWKRETTGIRVGLRASASSGQWSTEVRAALVGIDMPTDGATRLSLLGEVELDAVVRPTSIGSPAVSFERGVLSLRWTIGEAMSARASLRELVLDVGGSPVTIPTLEFPSTGPFGAGALGISAEVLDRAIVALAEYAASSWGGESGRTVAALFGVRGGRNLADIAAGSLLDDPEAALRGWLLAASTGRRPQLPRLLGAIAGADHTPGTGVSEDPWRLELEPGIELLTWLSPGPSAERLAGAREAIESATDFSTLLRAAYDLTTFVPGVRYALAQASRGRLAGALTGLAAHFAGGDGVVPIEAQVPPGWPAGEPVRSAHTTAPASPAAVEQIAAQIESWADPAERVVLLLASPFAEPGSWGAVIERLGANPDDVPELDLRGAADAVDDLRATAGLYRVHLDWDGGAAQVESLIDRLEAVAGSRPVVVVAHSVAGVWARSAASTRVDRVRGLVTIGSPHGGAPLSPLRDPDSATALRFTERLGVADRPGPLGAATRELIAALDGWRSSDGAIPVRARFRPSAFAGAQIDDAPELQKLAIRVQLEDDLLPAARDVLAELAAEADAASPTHLEIGFLATPVREPEVEVAIRTDVARVSLTEDASREDSPWRVQARALLRGAEGWLLGTPGDTFESADGRARWGELGVDVTVDGVVPFARLHEAGWRGSLSPVAQWPAPDARAVLGVVLTSDEVGVRRPVLLALESLGLVIRDGQGRLSPSADALDAVEANPAGFLGGRLAAAVADGSLWRALGSTIDNELAIGRLRVAVEGSPSQLIARTVADGIAVGPGAAVHATARVGGPQVELEAQLAISSFRLSWSSTTGRLAVSVEDWLEPQTLHPATQQELGELARTIAPRLMINAAIASTLRPLLPPELSFGAVDRLLQAPGSFMSRSGGLGDGQTFDGERIAGLLRIVSGLLDLPEGPGLVLPQGLMLTATGAAPHAQITLATSDPIGPAALDIEAHARIDGARHVGVSGRVAATFPLPGQWPSVRVDLTVSDAGIELALTPEGAEPIRLWPTSGLGSLAALADALLPAALEAIVRAIRDDADPPSPLFEAAMRVADALGLHDAQTGFAGRVPQLRDFAESGLDGLSAVDRVALSEAIADVLTVAIPGAPGSAFSDGTRVGWALALSEPDQSGVVEIGLDLEAMVGTLSLDGLTAGVVRAFARFEASATNVALEMDIDVALDGLPSPSLSIRGDNNGAEVRLTPLGRDTQDTLSITLAPNAGVQFGSSGLLELALGWGSALAAPRLLEAARPVLADPLWSGGPSLGKLLADAGIIATPTGPLVRPLSRPPATLLALLRALPTNVELSPTLRLRTINADGHVGVRFVGYHDVDLGTLQSRLLLGEPSTFVDDANRGLGVRVFSESNGDSFFDPVVEVVGCGLGLHRNDGAPLVDVGAFRVDGVRTFAFVRATLADGLTDLHGGLELDNVGIPVGLAASSGAHPVVAGLVGPSPAADGDQRPVAPPIDVAVFERGNGLQLRLDGSSAPTWVPVAQGFGPIFVDQVGVVPTPTPGVDVVIDGSVEVSGLQIGLVGLTLSIPFAALAKPDSWRVELHGLEVGFEGGGVTVSGVLQRTRTNPPTYDGFLLAEVSGRSFNAIGSYGVVSDARGTFSSIVAFARVPTPLGGPPPMYVTGLGAGAGYNRALDPPGNVREVPDFVLVRAMDDASLSTDPSRGLQRISDVMPARRGAGFFAAGAKFTSYGLVDSTVVASVALDRGVEVDVLGVSRMQLPRRGKTIANVELALRARYSSSERVIAVLAELTDRSWILDPSCQLTGGFALSMWLDDGQFVLTLGGYHPDFVKPARFPDVPRVGFHWRVSNRIVVKGECYFALTSSCVMAGGRLEATYTKGSVSAWFTAFANILVAWDPFGYDIEIGVSVGASWTLKVCFIKCVRVNFSVSIGADLRLRGPALHGTVTVSLAVASVTFDFGDSTPKPSYLPTFDAFAAKHLAGSDPVGIDIGRGLRPAAAPGRPPSGAADRPWFVGPELVLSTRTRMPASAFAVGDAPSAPAIGAASIDLAAMGDRGIAVGSSHRLRLQQRIGSSWTEIPLGTPTRQVTQIRGRVPEGTYRFRDDDDDTPAARTQPALVGLRLTTVAEPTGERPPLALVDLVVATDRSRALPLEAPGRVRLDALGEVADAVSAIATRAGTRDVNRVADSLLSDAPASVRMREGSGLLATGATALARSKLAERSSPPLVTPLGTGLKRRPPGVGRRPKPTPVEPPSAPLRRPRLRAVVSMGPAPTDDRPPRAVTRVSPELRATAVRRVAPRASESAGLVRVTAASAPRPTGVAAVGRSWRGPTTGSPVSKRARADALELQERSSRAGVPIAAGATQLWQLPARSYKVHVRGEGAARITFIGGAGQILDDVELDALGGAFALSPPGARAVAVGCLGAPPPSSTPRRGPGAVSRTVAPAGATAATGWELNDRAILVSASTALVRGGHLRVTTARLGATAPDLVELAALVRGPAAVETTLPAGTRLVLLLLDELDRTAAEAGDLRVFAGQEAGRAGAPMELLTRAEAGPRRALLYRVREAEAQRRLSVGVASARAFAIGGVVGLDGSAADWVARLDTGIPQGLVADEPITPYGSVELRLEEQS